MATTSSRASRTAAPPRKRPAARRSSANLTPILLAGGVAVVIVAIILASGEGTAPVKAAEAPPPPEIGWSSERVKAVASWLDCVQRGSRIELAVTTDLDAFQRRFKLGDSRMVSTLSGDERSALKDQILDALLLGEDTKLLREFTPYSGRLLAAAMATAPEGRATVELMPGEAVREQFESDAQGTLEVSFRVREGKLLIDGFTITDMPKPKVVPVAKPKERIRHDVIKKPVGRMVERGGEKFPIFEAEIVPLDHLADAPQELRTEIDALIGQLTDLSLRPRERTNARNRLREIGKPAIPRLLNRFNDIKADSADGIARLTQIDALLRDMSGRAFGYSPAEQTNLTTAKENEEARSSALKQWYGWWYYFHDKPLDWAFEDEEEEDLGAKPGKKKTATPEPKTKN